MSCQTLIKELFLDQLTQQTAEELARTGSGRRTAATTEQRAQHIADIAASRAMVLAKDRQQVGGDGSQDVGYLVVRGARLGGKARDNRRQIATEDFAKDLHAVFNIQAEGLTCMVAERLRQGRGTGSREAEELFKITVQPEKELVMILVPADIKDKVMTALYEEAGLESAGHGIAFSLPAERTLGLDGSHKEEGK
jgi:hypothetical protein